jgi:flagellar hook-length control protein FliK
MATDPVTRETVQPEFLKVKPEDLVKEIHRVLTSDDSRKVILNLQPEDLGNVKIEFDLKEKSMNAKISVETESAKNLIQTNSETLKNSLHSSGITLNSLNVLLSDGPRQQHVPIIKKKIQKNEIIEIQAEPVQIKRRNLGYNTYEYLA